MVTGSEVSSVVDDELVACAGNVDGIDVDDAGMLSVLAKQVHPLTVAV